MLFRSCTNITIDISIDFKSKNGMKGVIKFQAANTNHNPSQLRDGIATE